MSTEIPACAGMTMVEREHAVIPAQAGISVEARTNVERIN